MRICIRIKLRYGSGSLWCRSRSGYFLCGSGSSSKRLEPATLDNRPSSLQHPLKASTGPGLAFMAFSTRLFTLMQIRIQLVTSMRIRYGFSFRYGSGPAKLQYWIQNVRIRMTVRRVTLMAPLEVRRSSPSRNSSLPSSFRPRKRLQQKCKNTHDRQKNMPSCSHT